FLNGSPGFKTYNEHHPRITQRKYTFPEPTILTERDLRVEDTQIATEYLVAEPVYTHRSTVYDSRLHELQSREFKVVDSLETGTEWSFDRRVKVSEPIYETENRSFTTRGTRSTFLELHPEWMAAGSKDVVLEKTREISEWRDSQGGRGEFTGRTREVQVEPNRYRTEHQYQYEYTTTEHRTRTVTKRYQYVDRVSYSETVERCNRYIGCYESTVQRTRWVTRTGTREIKQSYTVEVTKSSTYWAESKRHHTHSYTGRTRSELIQPAQSETQFEYIYTESFERTETRFLAERTALVQSAQYEWSQYRTTRSQLVATELQSTSGVRLNETTPVTEWTLRKQIGTGHHRYSSFSNASEVEQTDVEISGTVVARFVDSATGLPEEHLRDEYTYKFSRLGYLDDEEIIEIYLARWMEVESE
ncbi:MAG: hypothetical protein ABEI52_05040, partial [Halobacteriaceae archaeon]